MSELPDFLLARIAEDEARVTEGARGARTSSYGWHTVDCGVGLGYWAVEDCVCRHVDRVLAECDAKRRIVEFCVASDHGFARPKPTGEYVLEFLALPYAGHDDYNEEWRP